MVKIYSRWTKFLHGLAFSFLTLLLIPFSAKAATITTGYGAIGDVQVGMIVGLSKTDNTKVEAVNSDRVTDSFGVIVNNTDSPITLSEEGQKVYVATSSKYDVLVSDQNGIINAGDYITVSAVNGIGMKADEFQSVVIGQATQSFTGASSPYFVSSASVADNSGKSKTLSIGKIQVNVGIAKNPLAKNVTDAPEVLRRAGQTIAGRAVTAPRLYISLILLIIFSDIAASIIYSAVRSGFIAIGRNPLSKRLILKGIFQMVLIALIILFAGLFGVYLILRL